MRDSSPYEHNEISATELGRSIKRRWWLPLVGLVLGLLLGLAFSVSQETEYRSVTTALVQASTGEDSATDRLAAEELAKSRVATYQSLGNSVVVADAVKRNLGLKASTSELLESVRVVGSPNSTDLEITATASTPKEAAELADAWRSALAEVTENPQPGDNIQVVPVGEPTVPERPSGISNLLIYSIGGAVGLLLGIVGAVALGRGRTTAQDEHAGQKPAEPKKESDSHEKSEPKDNNNHSSEHIEEGIDEDEYALEEDPEFTDDLETTEEDPIKRP